MIIEKNLAEWDKYYRIIYIVTVYGEKCSILDVYIARYLDSTIIDAFPVG